MKVHQIFRSVFAADLSYRVLAKIGAFGKNLESKEEFSSAQCQSNAYLDQSFLDLNIIIVNIKIKDLPCHIHNR